MATTSRGDRSYRSMYKSHHAIEQEQKRRQLLESQKRKRDDIIDQRRPLLDGIDESSEDADDEEVDCTVPRRKLLKRSKIFTNILMIPEWMRDVPSNLQDKWMFVLCPEGQRTVVHTSKGKTKMYDKRGQLLKVFPSFLPGGNNTLSTNSSVTLDCIWSRRISTIFILDLICWENQPFFSAETEYRRFMLELRLKNMTDVKTQQEGNKYPLIALEYFSCNHLVMSDVLSRPNPLELELDEPIEIDGLLFYHKDAHWAPGQTPLLLWTKLFMMPELFGGNVSFNPDLIRYPINYDNYLNYIDNFEKECRALKVQAKNPEDTDSGDVEMVE